jgi:hypothetical protein
MKMMVYATGVLQIPRHCLQAQTAQVACATWDILEQMDKNALLVLQTRLR